MEDLMRYEDWEEVMYFLCPDAGQYGVGYGIMQLDGFYCDGAKAEGPHVVYSSGALVTPLGKHPVTAGPENWLFYVWAYTGKALKKTYNRTRLL